MLTWTPQLGTTSGEVTQLLQLVFSPEKLQPERSDDLLSYTALGFSEENFLVTHLSLSRDAGHRSLQPPC